MFSVTAYSAPKTHSDVRDLTKAEWEQRLTPEQFSVCREQCTEEVIKPGLQMRVCIEFFSYFSTKTYIVGTQKNCLPIEHPEHMFKLMGKEIMQF